MPQSDILNPTPRHPLNPDYGFQRKRPVTHLVLKANQGAPYFRDLTDVGHQFVFNWADKTLSDARALKQYYEQYRGGFFTYIDHEGGGRHYVGRFTAPVEPIPTSHGHWTIQQVTFDEVPGAPMLSYPGDWNNDAIWCTTLDDFGNLMVASSGSWGLAVGGAGSISGDILVTGSAPAVGDSLQYQYVGYGFQFWAFPGPGGGIATISVDGGTPSNVDFYQAGPPIPSSPATLGSPYGANLSRWRPSLGSAAASTMMFAAPNLPLGAHIVKLAYTGTKNTSSSGYGISWDALRVMR